MSEIPRTSLRRSARLAAVPISAAGRAALGAGQRLAGKSASDVAASIQTRNAQQVFEVLGQLKGAALKFGQALSVLESALPVELVGPYRESLTKLQNAAPPLGAAAVHAQLTDALGPDWRDRFTEFDDTPTAAASLGQVHRAVWRDGRIVAVKVQYPGVADAVKSDLAQIQRFGRLLGSVAPGLDVKSLLAEVSERMKDELDYIRESRNQRAFAAAYEGDPDVLVPHVLAASPTVLVSEWVDATPLSRVIADGTQAERDAVGHKYLNFLLSCAGRVGMLHADPHPGNYHIAPDGRLVVLDFGAVAQLPDGLQARWVRCCASRWRVTPSGSCKVYAMRDSSARASTLTRSPCSHIWHRSASRQHQSVSTSTENGCARSSRASTTPDTRTSMWV